MPAIYSVANIRKIEQQAIQLGITANTMMQRAGQFAYQCLKQHFPQVKRMTIMVGNGNNGGDGYVLASAAKTDHKEVNVFYLGELTKHTDETAAVYLTCKNQGIPIQAYHDDITFDCDIIVDALCGIGIQGIVRDDLHAAITKINHAEKPIFAIDIPSGIQGDSGEILGCAVSATVTATFIGLKPGLITGAGINHAGKLVVDTLRLPPAAFASIFLAGNGIEPVSLLSALSPRAKNSHKGDFGHVVVVGGDINMPGAPRMSATAALRVGAGLVSIATQPKHAEMMSIAEAELMYHGIHDPTQLTSLLDKATVTVLGPGLGNTTWSQALFHTVLNRAKQTPLIIDADGLNLLANNPKHQSHWVLTPHPGEAARLLQVKTADIQQNRLDAATALQQKYGGIIVLKGARTIIAASDTTPAICLLGNPGMATAGMGDILSGIVGSLLAQGIAPILATQLGVMIHARAGDLAAETLGERGLMATDILPYLQRLANPTQFPNAWSDA